MKVKTYIDVQQEVTVDVSLEDITASIRTDTNSLSNTTTGVSNALVFLRAIPDETIAEMSEHVRGLIRAHLLDQANRFNR